MQDHSKFLFVAALFSGALLSTAGLLTAQEPDQVTAADLANAKPQFHAPAVSRRNQHAATVRASVRGIDSLQTFNGVFSVLGYDPSNFFRTNWSYNMVGNAPHLGGTTTFKAPVIPVSLLLLNADGMPRYVNGQLLYSDATQYVSKVLGSPVFEKDTYSSSETPTQFIDAIQRAEFWSRLPRTEASDNQAWHTLLKPAVKSARLMLVPQGSYKFALNADGSCCSYVLVDINKFGQLLFPATYPLDGSTPVGAAELSGDITTKDISTFLFPNTFLYFNGNPNDCCVLGFHSFDYEPGIPANGNLERFYVMNFSSWISPGLFGPTFTDITARSHELAETANDPFTDNVTPWWLAPNGVCQDDLETGDVIEGLSDATYPIRMNGFTYHPQNEALLQWFAFKPVSGAIDHAYSYPNTGVLTALSPLEQASCKK